MNSNNDILSIAKLDPGSNSYIKSTNSIRSNNFINH